MRGYNPKKHRRRSIRLPGYDYTQPGAYFVTIVAHDRELLFGDPVYRRVAETLWQRIPRHFPPVELDQWIVMPNHVHGIRVITSGRGEASRASRCSMRGVAAGGGSVAGQGCAGDASPLQRQAGGAPSGSLGAIVGNFKSTTARRINRIRHTPGGPVWQRNYWEHIIRTERALKAIRRYIAGNPARWELDIYNPASTGPDPQAAGLWSLLQET